MGKITDFVNNIFDILMLKLGIVDQYYDSEYDDENEERYLSYKDELFYYKFYKNEMSKQKKKQQNNSDINENTSTLTLMTLNMAEIKEYYALSKNMARKSFVLAVIMCILGFIVIASSLLAVFIVNISFIESLVPVIGGTIVEVIAGTSLSVYKKSLEQLNQYYESLHNNERYLSLVNLVDKLTDDKKDEAYINIINTQLERLK